MENSGCWARRAAQNVDTAKLAQDLQVRYQQDYITQWRAFLKSANVVRYNGLPDASQKLAKTSEQSVSAAGSILHRSPEYGS